MYIQNWLFLKLFAYSTLKKVKSTPRPRKWMYLGKSLRLKAITKKIKFSNTRKWRNLNIKKPNLLEDLINVKKNILRICTRKWSNEVKLERKRTPAPIQESNKLLKIIKLIAGWGKYTERKNICTYEGNRNSKLLGWSND